MSENDEDFLNDEEIITEEEERQLKEFSILFLVIYNLDFPNGRTITNKFFIIFSPITPNLQKITL